MNQRQGLLANVAENEDDDSFGVAQVHPFKFRYMGLKYEHFFYTFFNLQAGWMQMLLREAIT